MTIFRCFSRVKGFTDIRELKATTTKCFPNVSWETYVVLIVNGQYYAVTMKNKDFEIVVSKDFVRYCTHVLATKRPSPLMNWWIWFLTPASIVVKSSGTQK